MRVKRCIDRKKAIRWIIVVLLLSFIAIVYGTYGILYNQEIVTGRIYDEMDGLIPYLVLLASFPLLLLALVIGLFMKRKKKQ